MRWRAACGVLLVAAGTLRADPFAIALHGVLQVDARAFVAPRDGEIDQLLVRSLRLTLAGALDRTSFLVSPDLAGGKLVVEDAFLDYRAADGLHVRAGKMKVPFGLERLAPLGTTMFAERGLPSLLAPNRDVGAELAGALDGGAIALQAGVFDGAADGALTDGDVSSGKEVAVRVFAHPGGGLGLGAAGTIGDTAGTAAAPDLPRFTTQGGTTFFAYVPAAVAAGRRARVTAQAEWHRGPFGALAEYVTSAQDVALGAGRTHVTAAAWQLACQWVVLGGRASALGVVPLARRSALVIAARVAGLRIDGPLGAGLADPARSAERASSAGLGIDAYPTPALRLTLDLERTAFSGTLAPEASIVGRAQLTW